MFEINSDAHSFWSQKFGVSECFSESPNFHIQLADEVPFGHAMMKLQRIDGKVFVIMTQEAASRLGVTRHSSMQQLASALGKSRMKWYDEDMLFYLSDEHQIQLTRATFSDGVMELTAADSELFEDFTNRNRKQDLDDVEVELGNDAVVGYPNDAPLQCVADYYIWDNADIADIGVLTVPMARGRGIASKVIESLCQIALNQNLIPQYRCQRDNLASIRVAKKLGLKQYGLWSVAVSEDN